MFLSSIPVETGSDPNRPRPGRMWIFNPYRIHQRLSMAFDGKGLQRFLFRVEGPVMTRRGLRPRILVQSSQEPNWAAAFRNAPFLVVNEDLRTKVFAPAFEVGQRFRFCLRANPTVKKKCDGKKNGTRLGIMSEEGKLEWFARKAQEAGFIPLEVVIVPGGLQHSRRSRQIDPEPHVHLAVTFEGIIEVTDPVKLRAALENGIGSAKAYGFGLLSVASVASV
jgi:CRISPR system Cascade subunit CasE